TGVLYELEKAVVNGVGKATTPKRVDAVVKRIHKVVGKAIVQFLENGILEILKMGLLNQLQPTRRVKALAFVDHPTSFLTNADLQNALTIASERIGQNIDILGMDSCHMNMIEIGYGLRNSVNFMVASQDAIPDASMPYDKIISKLVSCPDISPQELASQTASTFLAAYKDYSDRPGVTLSVLDLKRSGSVAPFFRKFVACLLKASTSFSGRNSIVKARMKVRSFAANEFVDLLQ